MRLEGIERWPDWGKLIAFENIKYCLLKLTRIVYIENSFPLRNPGVNTFRCLAINTSFADFICTVKRSSRRIFADLSTTLVSTNFFIFTHTAAYMCCFERKILIFDLFLVCF